MASQLRDDFYVYVLFDWQGIPRYIGKGRGGRIRQHQTDRRMKAFVAQTILLLGDVPSVKIRNGLTEHEAYSLEQIFIRAIGRYPDGPLVNRTEKGSGPNSEQVRRWHARKTPEERRAHMQAAIVASVASPKNNKNARQDRIKYALAALTPKHHQAAADRLNASYSPEKRSIAAKKRFASMSPEQRSEVARKGIASQSLEQLSEIGRKRAAHMTKEQRKENAKRLLNSQTHEQLSENGKKGRRAQILSRAASIKSHSTANGSESPTTTSSPALPDSTNAT